MADGKNRFISFSQKKQCRYKERKSYCHFDTERLRSEKSF